jgi:hypothetical protein
MMPWAEVVVCEDPDCPDYGVRVARPDERLLTLPGSEPGVAETGNRPVSRQVRRQRQREARKRSARR